jgi:hypothetical protein
MISPNKKIPDWVLQDEDSIAEIDKQNKQEKFIKDLARANLSVRDIDADGNCMFRAISYLKYGTEDEHSKIRRRCIKYIRDHPEKYLDFMDGDNQL